MYMSVEEFGNRYMNALKTHKEIDKTALITNISVVQAGDSESTKYFAPGTIILNCVDTMDTNRWYEFSIGPEKVSRWLN